MPEQPQSPRERVWTKEHARVVVDQQVAILSNLTDEVVTLSAGKIGVIEAIKDKIADEVSFDPEIEITTETFRRLLGVPEDESGLEAWRFDFYTRFKENREATP